MEHGHRLTGIDARRAWRAARVRAHVLHHHETALWSGRPEGRFVAVEEPEPHVPVEARAEMLRRSSRSGPRRARTSAPGRMRMTEIKPALELLEPLRRFRDERGRELLDVEGAPLPRAVQAEVADEAARLEAFLAR